MNYLATDSQKLFDLGICFFLGLFLLQMYKDYYLLKLKNKKQYHGKEKQ